MSAHQLLIIVCFLLNFVISFSNFDPNTLVLQTKLGFLRGTQVKAFPSNETITAFLGIPVAETTGGENRFKKPIALRDWKGLQEATSYRVACVADPPLTYKNDDGGPVGEDCLHLNIFTNDYCLRTGGCAVVAIVHGGKFNFESPVIFPKEVVANNFPAQGRNVIAVTLSFRLGSFGSLNIAPGIDCSADRNIALHDILFHLKWMKDHITSFGGDPARVTLMGHSSGAGLVDLVSLSPASENLFNQVILMSGQASLFGAEYSLTENERASLAIATRVGCYNPLKLANKMLSYKVKSHLSKEQIELVLACLRRVSYEEILQAQISLYNSTEDFYGPGIEGANGLLPKPISQLRRFKRRTLIGTTTAESKEGSYIENEDGSIDLVKLREMCTHYGFEMAFEDPWKFVAKCQEYYSKYEKPRNFYDDLNFYVGSAVVADAVSRTDADVFVYSYSYNGAGAAFRNWTNVPLSKRPSHSEDYIYVMGIHRGPFIAKDYENEKIYSGMLVKFINGEKPHPRWKSWNRKNRNYFDINFDRNLWRDGPKEGYYTNASRFWNEKNLGHQISIKTYPPSFDTFGAENLITALESHHLQVSTAHDKTLDAEERIYYEWTDWLINQITLHENKASYRGLNGTELVDGLATETPANDEGTTFWTIMLYIGIGFALLVLLFLVYKGIRKLLETRKRYDYYELLN
ncbi:unnamed protein product, partial [Mesorhabditis belari]|uniref:Carboxylic ester hydrolase n=1 Tax=Mesorhabditis belari TaxID=2138241 RepID=A0AAF3EB24_9BILA